MEHPSNPTPPPVASPTVASAPVTRPLVERPLVERPLVASFAPPCQIAFGNMDPSEPPRAEVRAWLQKLGPLASSMIAGRVLIEAIDDEQQQRPDRRHDRRERRFRVRVDLTMPHGAVTVAHDHPSNGPHEDVYVAIRNAFRGARRELERYSLSQADAPVDPPSVVV